MITHEVQTALNTLADLLSDASPNRVTDPKTAKARWRATKHFTDKQQATFNKQAMAIVEWAWTIQDSEGA